MKRILQQYLASQFILPFLLSTAFFITFLLTFQMFKVTRLIVNKDIELGLVLEIVGRLAISFLPLAIPLAALFATIYVLGKLSEDSELIAMRSFGLTRAQILTPFFLIGLAIALATFGLNTSTIPQSKKAFRKILSVLTSKGFLSNIKEGQFYNQIPGITIYADGVKEDSDILTDVFINQIDKQKTQEQVIYAKEGILKKTTEIHQGHVGLRLLLKNGNIIRNSLIKDKTEKILFETYDIPIGEGSIGASFSTKDSMKTSSQLWRQMQLSPAEKKQKKLSPKDMAKARIEFWKRINTPISILIFILLGMAFGIKNARGKRRNNSTVVFIIVAIYYALFFTGVALAKKDLVPTPIAIFFPSIMGLIVGTKYYKKLEWTA